MKEIPLCITLFGLTFLSTFLLGGIYYSFALLTVLSAHEVGHYVASRLHGVRSTLPYFIPFPLPPFGTLGAVIKTKAPIPNRKALFDIGVAGPFAGLALSVTAIGVGLRLSHLIPVEKVPEDAIRLSNPLFFSLVQRMVLGSVPENHEVILHPIAYAGWVGLFVTALNLLPIGQLDGGHVMYALLGRNSRRVFRLSIVGLVLTALFLNVGWLALVLLLLGIGYRHPAPLDDLTPLDSKRKLLGLLAIVVFVLSFTPTPFPQWSMGLKDLLWRAR